MIQKPLITVSQLFIMLFLSRMVVNLTYNPLFSGSDGMWEHIVSAGISYVLIFLLFLPIYLLSKRRPGLGLIDDAYLYLGKFGAIIGIVYGLYFVMTCCYTLSLFDLFVANVMSPRTSLLVLSVAVAASACYGAFKGIEALARASGIIFVLVLASLVFLVCALLFMADPIHFTPVFYNGSEQAIGGVLLMLGRSSCLPALAILIPFAKGNLKKGFIAWNTCVYAVIALVITAVVGALGDYLKTQMFPIYAAANAAQLGVFQRMDALYIGIWMMGIFLKISLFLYLFSLCMASLFGEKAARRSILPAAVAVIIISLLVTEFRDISRVLFNLYFLFGCSMLVTLIIPLLLLILDFIYGRKERKNHDF